MACKPDYSHQRQTQFVISGCMGLLIWWLDSGVPYSAEEIHSTFRRLVTQGVRGFLATT